MSCVFCQIAEGTVPATVLFKDDKVVAFRDIHPQAPVHILIIPIEHFTNLTDIQGDDYGLISYIFSVANDIAKSEDIAERGYRVVVNSGQEGGQVVQHLHFHLLGGATVIGRIRLI